MRNPIAKKTWINFMTHFHHSYQELRDTDATIDQLGFQSANAIVEQIFELLRADNEVVPSLSPPPPDQEPPVHGPPLQVPQANTVTPVDQNSVLMQQMMQNMHHMAFHGCGRGRGRGRGREGKGRGHGRQDKQAGSEKWYCHTHRSCAIIGADCNTPGMKHKNVAAFADMMGGSTARCFWINK